jgi:hypothetical protein
VKNPYDANDDVFYDQSENQHELARRMPLGSSDT